MLKVLDLRTFSVGFRGPNFGPKITFELQACLAKTTGKIRSSKRGLLWIASNYRALAALVVQLRKGPRLSRRAVVACDPP